MLNLIAVFIGGAIGSLLRYLTGLTYIKFGHMTLPVATISVNIIGCFIFGFTVAFFAKHTDINPIYKYFIIVGICGGLTTFSTFSFEVFELLESGKILIAIAYALLSNITCFSMAAVGFYWAKAYV